jgi:hypothetical protein
MPQVLSISESDQRQVQYFTIIGSFKLLSSVIDNDQYHVGLGSLLEFVNLFLARVDVTELFGSICSVLLLFYSQFQ